MPKDELIVLQDHVADTLDDLAALGAHWTRNRERGRMPQGIRQAMLIVAREALAYAEASDREMQAEMSRRFGPEAYQRNNGDETPNAPHEGPARASCAGPLDAVVGGLPPGDTNGE